jgi:hypothetical protein
MKNIIILILGIILAILPKLKDSIKFNIYMFANSKIISQILFNNLIFLVLFDNNMAAILLIAIFITIYTTDKDKINEGFISYYKKT